MAADVRQHIMIQPNKAVEIEILRGNAARKLTATLSEQTVQDDIGNSAKIGFLGVELPQAFERSPNLAAALTKGVNDGLFSIYVQYTTLHQIVTGQRKIMELSRSEEHTSELQSLMRQSYAVFCLKKTKS